MSREIVFQKSSEPHDGESLELLRKTIAQLRALLAAESARADMAERKIAELRARLLVT